MLCSRDTAAGTSTSASSGVSPAAPDYPSYFIKQFHRHDKLRTDSACTEYFDSGRQRFAFRRIHHDR
jgi:hypothetical protein